MLNSRLLIGTSGYSYGEWVDAGFYPKGTHATNMLDHYITHFPATELNYTWYQMPKAAATERMCQKVPDHFQFSLKLTRTMTHEIKKDQWVKEALSFRHGIAPLVDSGRLLCVLVQLPPWFKRTIPFRNYLSALLDELAGLPISVEFRHASWDHEKVFSEFERRSITLVSVDAPDIPGLFPFQDVLTNPKLFYVRLHGRNAQGWGAGDMQQQFNYDYSQSELSDLAIVIKEHLMPKADTGAVFFNNHVQGQAPKNALALAALLS